MKTKRWMWLFAVLSVLMIAFIWSHSLQSRDQSSQESLGLLAMLTPMLKALGVADPESLHGFLRKAAHFAEFGALGLCICGFTVNLGRLLGQRLVSMPLFAVLSVAVADEFIQLFSGRAAMVQDVVLDFAGGLTGIAFAVACCWLGTIGKNKEKGK